MAVSGDVLKVAVQGSLAGQAADNVYHYGCDEGTATATEFANAFKLQVLDNVMSMQSTSYGLLAVTVTNLSNPADNAIVGYIGVNGSRAGDCNPSFVAYGFEYVPYISGVNSGGKRIAGVAESDCSNSVVTATALSNLVVVGNVLASSVGAGVDGTFRPMIARYEEDAEGHMVFVAGFYVSGVTFKRVTSQVSRLIGRGA